MRVTRLGRAIVLTMRQGGMDDSTLPLPFNFAGFPQLARHNDFAFLGEEGREHLKEYLEWRLRRGRASSPGRP
jgi:hypothetical protein